MARNLAFLLILLFPLFGASDRNWQDARVVDVGTEYFTTSVGGQTNGRVDASGNIQSTTTTSTSGGERWTYTIDIGKYLVTGMEVLKWRWSKPARVIVGENVKYFMVKRDVYIQDLDGKEHKLSLIKQVLKAEPLPAAPKE